MSTAKIPVQQEPQGHVNPPLTALNAAYRKADAERRRRLEEQGLSSKVPADDPDLQRRRQRKVLRATWGQRGPDGA